MQSVNGKNPLSATGINITFDSEAIASAHDIHYEGELWISAGLIDLQVNGFAGYDLNDGDVDTDCVLSLANRLLTHGVTTFLPTVITAGEAQISQALSAIAKARDKHALLTRMIPGIHLEGPYISPADGPRGAHPATHVQAPDLAQFDRWQKTCGGLVSMVTLSPHWPDSAEFIRTLTQRGIYVALGHTHADHAQITAAVDAGAVLSTHLGNGAPAIMPRHPNMIWSQLAEDRLTASFIADGHHLPGETLTSMLRSKGLSRSLLVSDVAAPGGQAPGVYTQKIGGQVELTENGRLSIAGTPYLAGAARPLSDCVATAVTLTGITLNDALRLATENPGQFAGQPATLKPGNPANIIVFKWKPGDQTLNIQYVYQSGECVYTKVE